MPPRAQTASPVATRYARTQARDRARALPGRPNLSTDDIGRIMAAALAQQAERNQAYTAEQMERDPAWGSVPFGPGLPLQSQAINRLQDRTGRPAPRSYQYDVSENIQISERDRLTPWRILQDAADQPLFRKCINRRKSISELDYAVTIDPKAVAARQANPKDKGEARDIESSLRREYTSEIVRISEFLEEPDNRTGYDWEHWVAVLMEQHLVFDAVAVTVDTNMGGEPTGFRVIDGKTVKPLIDEWGIRPLPPRPAFQQILWGYPRGEYAAASAVEADPDIAPNTVFAANELAYERRNVRIWTQYGLPPTETALIDGLLWSRRFGWILGEYTEGVQPASFLVNKGDVEWSPELNADYEHSLNDRLSGNTAERMRYKLLPVGIEPVQSVEHAERYRPDYDLFIVKLVAGDFGIPITEIGFTETGALGSSFHEGNQDILNRQTRLPDSKWVSKKATWLCRRYMRMPPVLRVQILGLESEDEAAADAVALQQVRSGRMTLNQDNARRGLPPYDFKEADKPMLMTDRGLVYIEGSADSAPPGVLIEPPHIDLSQPGQTPKAGTTAAGGAPASSVTKHVARQPADHVIAQLAENFPVSQLEWVRHAQWAGPMEVPLDQVDFAGKESWRATREPDKVRAIGQKIDAKHARGKHAKPLVAVRVPGKSKIRIVDGHHHALAYLERNQPVWAWVGHVSHETGPWDELHEHQFGDKDDYPEPAGPGTSHAPADAAAAKTVLLSHGSVDYRPSQGFDERCGTCAMRTPDGCTAVEPPIDDQGVCNIWAAVIPGPRAPQPPADLPRPGGSEPAGSGEPDADDVPASPEVMSAEKSALRRWLAKNPRPRRPFACQVLKAGDLGRLATDPRVLPADGRPKAPAATGQPGTRTNP